MKRYDAMRLSGTVLLAHLALCAAFLLLLIAASGSTSTFTFRSPYGLVLGLLFVTGVCLWLGAAVGEGPL